MKYYDVNFHLTNGTIIAVENIQAAEPLEAKRKAIQYEEREVMVVQHHDEVHEIYVNQLVEIVTKETKSPEERQKDEEEMV